MDDACVWEVEANVWTGGPDRYRDLVDEACLMVLPAPPYVRSGGQTSEAVASTRQCTDAAPSRQRISWPQEGLIVVAYHIEVSCWHETNAPRRTSTYRRLGPDDWQAVQHQQPFPLAADAKQ